MNLSKLSWIKNVKHQGNDRTWAYNSPDAMAIPEAKIFRLNWRDTSRKDNAKKPNKSDLMLLLQKAKVTHVVEFIDDEVYDNNSNEWGIYRIVKTLWMPPKSFDWETLPHQRKFFGFDYVVGDGVAHDLSTDNRMQQFHRYWNERDGLEAFQRHVGSLLSEISSEI